MVDQEPCGTSNAKVPDTSSVKEGLRLTTATINERLIKNTKAIRRILIHFSR